MKNRLIIVALVVIGLVFSACSDKKPFTETKVLSDAALVYVYVAEDSNVDDTHLVSSYNVGINGNLTDKSLYAGEYIKLDVKPLTLSISIARKDIEIKTIKFIPQAGKTYYLRAQSYSSSFGKFDFEQVSNELGSEEITKTVSSSEFMIKGNIMNALATSKGTDASVSGMSEADINAIIEKKLAERKLAAPAQNQVATSTTSTAKATKTGSKLMDIRNAYEMKKEGLLTDAEFKAMKSEILAK